jgi:hypothetical protein
MYDVHIDIDIGIQLCVVLSRSGARGFHTVTAKQVPMLPPAPVPPLWARPVLQHARNERCCPETASTPPSSTHSSDPSP